jgi:TetR/AcrR family transcriptional regulator, regulator of autoinduction and epiphytic fitness
MFPMTNDTNTEVLDPRQQRTRQRVFDAARAVLRREGLGGTTMDAIAAEAEVARSTLYRNWATREELLAEAFDDLVEQPAPVDVNAPIADQLATVLAHMARALGTSEWGATLPAVVAAIDAEPTLADRYGRLTTERRSELRATIAHAIHRGDLPSDLAIDDFIDALVGPLFYRRLIRQLSTSRQWTRRHLERTLAAFE